MAERVARKPTPPRRRRSTTGSRQLFAAMDKGDPVLNVPTYNGGLVQHDAGRVGQPRPADRPFLLDHKVPDRYLALAIDRLARDQDERTLALVFIDYKSLEVRHLGSIYEGLLEFKLKVAEEDLDDPGRQEGRKVHPALAGEGQAAASRPRSSCARTKSISPTTSPSARRPAPTTRPTPSSSTSSANTVGPVLDEKLEAAAARVPQGPQDVRQRNARSPQAYPRQGSSRAARWTTASGPGCKPTTATRSWSERLFDLRVLDPAMGSGHFLVETVDFITDRLLKFLNQFPINPVNFALERTRASILESLGEQGVTVDPGKLTDINLLKRHVLKRCIYGVDLNPMAVELAKVSLWLDAFTLGAPLNFLDHHLRCGNSLIGATFDDLRGETEGRLFSVNYAPLMLAILALLKVNQRADATAAEVGESATDYSTCRKDLDGYRVALDAAAAASFGITGAGQFATLAEVEPDAVESECSGRGARAASSLPRSNALPPSTASSIGRSNSPRRFSTSPASARRSCGTRTIFAPARPASIASSAIRPTSAWSLSSRSSRFSSGITAAMRSGPTYLSTSTKRRSFYCDRMDTILTSAQVTGLRPLPGKTCDR